LLPELHKGEGSDEKAKKDKKDNYSPAVPLVLSSAPLQREQEANNRWDEDCSSIEVEVLHASFPANILNFGSIWGLEEEENHYHGYGTNWQVDVEAPAPCS
jgi:hypothetical protein